MQNIQHPSHSSNDETYEERKTQKKIMMKTWEKKYRKHPNTYTLPQIHTIYEYFPSLYNIFFFCKSEHDTMSRLLEYHKKKYGKIRFEMLLIQDFTILFLFDGKFRLDLAKT